MKPKVITKEVIRARMKELGYNPNSLSVAATGKKDNIRNLFRGKSTNLRGDNFEKVVNLLWPDDEAVKPKLLEKSSPLETKLSDVETGLLAAIYASMAAISTQFPDVGQLFRETIKTQITTFQLAQRSDVVGVLKRLETSLGSEPSLKEPRTSHKTPPLHGDQYQNEKD